MTSDSVHLVRAEGAWENGFATVFFLAVAYVSMSSSCRACVFELHSLRDTIGGLNAAFCALSVLRVEHPALPGVAQPLFSVTMSQVNDEGT